MRIWGGKVFSCTHGFIARDLQTDGARISKASGDKVMIDATGCYVIPGLTDLHFHGCMGHDFSDGNIDGLGKMADYELSQGVTQICPAGMTLAEDMLSNICKMGAEYKKTTRSGATLVGIQLEGPFLSYEKRGAQNGEWIHELDAPLLKRLMADSEGLVKLVAIAPELAGAEDFIREMGDKVTLSLAHTTADYETAKKAFALGARQATHLYNAMPAYHHRNPGVIGAAMDNENVMVELICDGVHIHESVVRGTFRMFGAERVILISDTMRAAGMADGDYTLGGQKVIVKGKLATLEDGTIAGSATNLMDCLRMAVKMGISLKDAVLAASYNPAKALGILADYGTLDEGKFANFVILNEDLSLRAVVHEGKILGK